MCQRLLSKPRSLAALRSAASIRSNCPVSIRARRLLKHGEEMLDLLWLGGIADVALWAVRGHLPDADH